MTQSGATTRLRVDMGAMVLKGYSAFLKDLVSGTSPSYCLMSYPLHSLGSLTPPQRISWCILLP